jgi:hypothetical protein
MKKVLTIAILALVATVSYAQDKVYVINRKANDQYDMRKQYNAILSVKDSVIDFREAGISKIYIIKKKQVVNGNLSLYLVKDEDNQSEFLISENPKVIEHTKTYTRLLDEQPKKSTEFYYFTGNMNSPKVNDRRQIGSEKQGSFGVTSGVSAYMGVAEITSVAYGGWLMINDFGIEYNASAGMNMSDPFGDDYVSGRVGEWTSGGVSYGIGGFYKSKSGFYYGGGIQVARLIGVRNEKMGQDIYSNGRLISKSYIEPKVFDDKKVSPYITGGYMTELGQFFTFKGGIIASPNFSSIQVGIGYSF